MTRLVKATSEVVSVLQIGCVAAQLVGDPCFGRGDFSTDTLSCTCFDDWFSGTYCRGKVCVHVCVYVCAHVHAFAFNQLVIHLLASAIVIISRYEGSS